MSMAVISRTSHELCHPYKTPAMTATITSPSAIAQLPLSIGLRDDCRFDNYFVADNREAVAALQQHAPEPPSASTQSDTALYLWGSAGTGKTHLLQAACHHAAMLGSGLDSSRATAVAYLPLAQASMQADQLDPAMLEGLEYLALICIDDIQAIAGQPEWETALFHLYNRIRLTGTRCIIAGNSSPHGVGLHMPDLVSRLCWGQVLHLNALDDEAVIAALQLRARHRGLELSEEVARFLWRHYPRDMTSLFALLERLDRDSLAAQRKLTIPFVKTFMQADRQALTQGA